MKTLILIVLSVLILVVVIITATLMKNQAHVFQSPGPFKRLSVYLTQHQAETSDNHSFPELRTRTFNVNEDHLFNTVLAAVQQLGWQLEQSDDENLSAHIVITTPMMRFKDDLVVQVKLVNTQLEGEASALLLRSSSRVGKADFAANAGHIQALVAAVDYKLRSAALHLFKPE